MTATELWKLGACEIAELVRSGSVSAEDAVGAAIGRMRAVNPALNAVVDDLGDAALAKAAELDRKFAAQGPVGPLHGVPVTVKINVDQKDRATSNGVAAFANLIAAEDSPVVRNLRNAGAVIIGRTNTPEFSFRPSTDNPLFGRTVNPWNEALSPGGSSGGAAVAVISGMGALAHGNDLGGSLRYPAAATGAVTVKPGLGRVPAYNPSARKERGLLAQLMSAQGVLGREVRDLRLGLRALMAYDPRDPWMVPLGLETGLPYAPRRVALARDGLGFGLHPAVDRALTTAAEALVAAGYEVEEAEPPHIRECGDFGFRALLSESLALLQGDMAAHGSNTINRIFQDHLAVFSPFTGDEMLQAMGQRSHFVREWQLFLERRPLVLTPFLLGPIHGWNRDAEGVEGARAVLGRGQYSFAINFLGLPAGHVTAGYHDGMPVGVQIVGGRFREDMILDALEVIERQVGSAASKLADMLSCA